MNIDDISRVLYSVIKNGLNSVYGYSAANMPLTVLTRAHMILISVDMIARGEY